MGLGRVFGPVGDGLLPLGRMVGQGEVTARLGRKPFEGETAVDVVLSILNKEPPPLAHHAGGIPPALERIVAKALSKERDERYQTAAELLGDLRALKHRVELHTADRALDGGRELDCAVAE